jgi:predicted NAD/FAD-binding protein
MDYLDVAMTDTAMSFSVSAEDGRYEYSGEQHGHPCWERRGNGSHPGTGG